MVDDPTIRREVETVSRWLCIILWTFIMAPAFALLLAFPLCWILFFIFPGYMFVVGPPGWAAALYLSFWIGGAFLLGYRGRLPGTNIPTTFHCASCGYNLKGNTSGVCPECGTPV